MSDKHMGGLLAFVIAAPIMLICCGGGGVVLAAILGGIGGWLAGLGGIAMVTAAFGAVLLAREIKRRRSTTADAHKTKPVASPRPSPAPLISGTDKMPPGRRSTRLAESWPVLSCSAVVAEAVL